MAKFKVGQKVKIIGGEYKKLVGTITTIISYDKSDKSWELGLPTENVKYNYWSRGHDIEPVYDGDEKSSWSSCAWKPNWIKSHG